MKKIFGVLIAAFLLCLAGCDPNVNSDSSDLHGCSYVEVNRSEFISALSTGGLQTYSDKLSTKGYLAEAIDFSTYSAFRGIIAQNGNRPNVAELSENQIKSKARNYGASDYEISAVINNLQNYKNACLAKDNGSRVIFYLF